MHAGPAGAGGPREIGEIDMCGQVGRSRRCKRVRGPALAQRLQAVAGRAFGGAVIEEQRHAGMAQEPRGQFAGDGAGRFADLHDLALGRVPVQRPGRLLDKTVRPHEPLRPAIAAADELADRQGIEELVGQQQQRGVGQGIQPVVPACLRPGQPFRLHGPQPRRGLDQVHTQSGPEIRRHPADGAQRVRHQRAAARPGLRQHNRVGPAEQRPAYRRPGAEHFAEGLADLGGCREIGERVAVGVICRIGARHERVQPLSQWAHHAWQPAGRAERARCRRSPSAPTAAAPSSRRRTGTPETRPAGGRTRR